MGRQNFEKRLEKMTKEDYKISDINLWEWGSKEVKLAEAEFLKKGSFRPWMKTWAIEEFDVIQNDMTEWSRYVSD